MNALAKAKDISETSRAKKMTNPVIHDFVALLFVYNDLLKDAANRKMRDKRMGELNEFFNGKNGRILKNKVFFEKNQVIAEYYKFISGVIKYIINQNNNPKHKNYF